MRTNPPPTGSVIRYPYLWVRQAASGETEGRKDRPCCLAIRVEREGLHHLILLAISSKPPASDQSAIEIPDIERRRGGLSRYPAAWLVVSEYNYDIAEESYYLDPAGKVLGAFSPPFMANVARVLRPLLTARGARVNRNA